MKREASKEKEKKKEKKKEDEKYDQYDQSSGDRVFGPSARGRHSIVRSARGRKSIAPSTHDQSSQSIARFRFVRDQSSLLAPLASAHFVRGRQSIVRRRQSIVRGRQSIARSARGQSSLLTSFAED